MATSNLQSRRIRTGQITLGMSPPMADALENLSEEMGAPVEDVLTQAVALLMVAVEAQGRGERLCFADDDLNVVGEVINFGIAEEADDDDPPREVESGRPDP